MIFFFWKEWEHRGTDDIFCRFYSNGIMVTGFTTEAGEKSDGSKDLPGGGSAWCGLHTFLSSTRHKVKSAADEMDQGTVGNFENCRLVLRSVCNNDYLSLAPTVFFKASSATEALT